MTEAEAQAWITDRWGDAAADRLRRFGELLREESTRQNLISAATVPHLWVRHLLDSAQLLAAVNEPRSWADVGSGAGLPGAVVALLKPDLLVHLIEPRRRRVEFLQHVIAEFGLLEVRLHASKVEALSGFVADVISARAVGSVDALFVGASGIADRSTTFILPRGRLPSDAITSLQTRWRGVFHVKQSMTDPESSILIASQVAAR